MKKESKIVYQGRGTPKNGQLVVFPKGYSNIQVSQGIFLKNTSSNDQNIHIFF